MVLPTFSHAASGFQRTVVRQFGPAADVVRLENYQPPRLEPGQVRVRMTVCAINPSDLITIAGAYASRTPVPFVPGFEGVGFVEEVAPGTIGCRVGDRVLPIGSMGAWQSHKITRPDWCFRVPPALPEEMAATAYVNPMSAWLMMRDAGIGPASRVALNAAGSEIGRMLIRLAVRAGATPLAVVRQPAAADDLAGLGATVLAEGAGLSAALGEATAGRGLDLALDAVGGSAGARLGQALKPGGRLVHYGLLSGEPLPSRLFERRPDVRVTLFRLRDWIHAAARADIEAALEQVFPLVQQGLAASRVAARYPLGEITAALRHCDRPGRPGKVLLEI